MQTFLLFETSSWNLEESRSSCINFSARLFMSNKVQSRLYEEQRENFRLTTTLIKMLHRPQRADAGNSNSFHVANFLLRSLSWIRWWKPFDSAFRSCSSLHASIPSAFLAASALIESRVTRCSDVCSLLAPRLSSSIPPFDFSISILISSLLAGCFCLSTTTTTTLRVRPLS